MLSINLQSAVSSLQYAVASRQSSGKTLFSLGYFVKQQRLYHRESRRRHRVAQRIKITKIKLQITNKFQIRNPKLQSIKFDCRERKPCVPKKLKLIDSRFRGNDRIEAPKNKFQITINSKSQTTNLNTFSPFNDNSTIK